MNSLSLSHSLTHIHSLLLTHFDPVTHFHSLPRSHSLTHTHTHSLSLSLSPHTHTHTHTHTHNRSCNTSQRSTQREAALNKVLYLLGVDSTMPGAPSSRSTFSGILSVVARQLVSRILVSSWTSCVATVSFDRRRVSSALVVSSSTVTLSSTACSTCA